MEKPRYQHDCSTCTFLGRYKEYDLYYCPQGGREIVIGRFSDDGPDYISGILFAKNGTSAPLVEALKRANGMGLIEKRRPNH